MSSLGRRLVLVLLLCAAVGAQAAPGYGWNGRCFETQKLAAQAECAGTTIQVTQNAGTTYLVGCSGVGGTDSAPTFTIVRSVLGGASTSFTKSTAYPPCADKGAEFDWSVWAAYVLLAGVGYIGGRQR